MARERTDTTWAVARDSARVLGDLLDRIDAGDLDVSTERDRLIVARLQGAREALAALTA